MFYTVCFVCPLFPAPAGTAAAIAILRDAMPGIGRRTSFQTANVIKFPHSAFFPFTFRYPAHSPAQTPAKIARCAASASRQPKFGHQASTAGHGSRRFREWPKIPQHGSCISRFASRPHGSHPSSRKPRERNRKHRPAAGRNYHDNQCKLFLKGQYQGP